MDGAETLDVYGAVENIGVGQGHFYTRDGDGRTLVEKIFNPKTHCEALQTIIDWLHGNHEHGDFGAAAHRIVHGGDKYIQPNLVSPELVSTLESLVPFAPEHLPHEINAIKELTRLYPDLIQVACFDTAFHRSMPRVAQIFAIPRDLLDDGLIRYGFHGLSYEYIMHELMQEPGVKAERIIIAHLGNGASMVAVKNGRSVDTSMGFTPAGGLVMSTRSGDVDPGVLLYLFKEKHMDASAVNRLINKHSGLLGVSGTSSDMKDLLEAESRNPQAAEAIELFCYQAKKFIGSYAAALGGIDTLIFTGGMGENSPAIRRRICADMDFLGMQIDHERNENNAPVISVGPVAVRVMKTNEALMMARHTKSIVQTVQLGRSRY